MKNFGQIQIQIQKIYFGPKSLVTLSDGTPIMI